MNLKNCETSNLNFDKRWTKKDNLRSKSSSNLKDNTVLQIEFKVEKVGLRRNEKVFTTYKIL